MSDLAYAGSNRPDGPPRAGRVHGRRAVLGMTRAPPYCPLPEGVLKTGRFGVTRDSTMAASGPIPLASFPALSTRPTWLRTRLATRRANLHTATLAKGATFRFGERVAKILHDCVTGRSTTPQPKRCLARGYFGVVLHKTQPKDVGPRAGALGIASIVLYGILTVVAVFVAAYLWSDGDESLAGIIAVSSLMVPVAIGFFFAETKSQRAGAIAFVAAAALFSGAVAAYAYQERDAYEERRDERLPEGLDDADADSGNEAQDVQDGN